MTKAEFLARLGNSLSFLSESDIKGSVEYYSELIDDYIDDGIPEAEAVQMVGDIDEIVKTIIADVPLPQLVKQRFRPKRRLGVMAIILIIAGSPVWLPVGIAIIAVLLSVYISLWAVIISLYAVDLSLAAAGLGMIAACFLMADISTASMLFVIGASVLSMGLSVLWFFACNGITKGFLWLTKKTLLLIKTCFARKGEGNEDI